MNGNRAWQPESEWLVGEVLFARGDDRGEDRRRREQRRCAEHRPVAHAPDSPLRVTPREVHVKRPAVAGGKVRELSVLEWAAWGHHRRPPQGQPQGRPDVGARLAALSQPRLLGERWASRGCPV